MKEKFKKHILRLLLAIMIAGISVPAINMIQPQAVEVQAAAKRNGWTKKGRYKYYYKNGKKLTGKRKLGKYYYYFDKKGRMQTGNKKIGRSWYSFDKSGRMRQNKIVSGYYYQKNGVRYTKKNRFVKVSGKYYWVNNKGKCTVKKGWRDESTARDTIFPIREFPLKEQKKSESIIITSIRLDGCRKTRLFPGTSTSSTDADIPEGTAL